MLPPRALPAAHFDRNTRHVISATGHELHDGACVNGILRANAIARRLKTDIPNAELVRSIRGTMESSELVTTNRKALTINLDEAKYGTFAEIGAGQEVARYFFQAGGAAGTVAKSISAYDMKFSDAFYGKSARYVSRERLELMLSREYDLLIHRLEALRGERSAFFVFSDTVAARSFKGTNECHGWMGVRFQAEPQGPTSDIILHVRMLDKENVLQQQALGVIGVNLLYGAFYLATVTGDTNKTTLVLN